MVSEGIHCGNVQSASKLLNKSKTCINDHLLPILNDEPLKPHGSFSGMIEEYVEEICSIPGSRVMQAVKAMHLQGGGYFFLMKFHSKSQPIITLEACAI